MKANYVADVIEAYIQSVMGAGKDPNPANEWEVYEITLQIEFDDSITVTHNCGNLGLVAGILLVILRGYMKTRKEIINECVDALEACYNSYSDKPFTLFMCNVVREQMEHVVPRRIMTEGLMLSGSWDSVFEEAMCRINPAPPHSRMSLDGFTIGDVVSIKHIQEGENGLLDWICIGQLRDGRWFNLEDGQVVVADSYGVLMRLGCSREVRRLFGH